MLTDEIKKFMAEHGVTKDEVWPVPGGKAYAVKHSALERIAIEKNIVFGPPKIIESHGAEKIYSMWVEAHLGERIEWATGEAAPHNNKNGYPLAMAEKRAKDRVVLKLLAAHGLLYSEEEADDFKQSRRAPDEREAAEIIPITDGPRKSSNSIKKNQPDLWPTIVDMFRSCQSYRELKETAASEFVQTATKDWPIAWLEALRNEEYMPLAKSLKAAEADANNSVVWAG